MEAMCKMVEESNRPYDPAYLEFKGNTYDRHPWSVVGNLCEQLYVATLISRGVDPASIVLCDTIEDQFHLKLDVRSDDPLSQVKKARIGTYGQLGISASDLEGESVYVGYVDMAWRVIHILQRAEFLRFLKDKDWSRPTVLKYPGGAGKPPVKGWWINRDHKGHDGLDSIMDTWAIPACMSVVVDK
jgi:hypothetical protein